MIALFSIASVPGEKPTVLQDSGLLSRLLAHAAELFSLIPPVVHNILHVPGHALLAWTLYWPLARIAKTHFAAAVAAILIATIYGALLEWHQISVPGRNASGSDVLLNFIGALCGGLLAGRARG